MANSKTFRNQGTFLWVPILFAAITCAVLYLMLAPTVGPYLGLAKYMFSDTPKAQPATLFSGISEDIAKSGNLALSEISYPNQGDLYGNVTIDGTSVNAPLYYGDATKQLNHGVGTYVDTFGAGIPGEGKTVLVAGHNTTFFNGLQDVKEGSIVQINTHYGSYLYEVQTMRVALATATDTYDFTRKDENLILYTCYPFDAFGLTPERYFVYAKYISGPVIDAER